MIIINLIHFSQHLSSNIKKATVSCVSATSDVVQTRTIWEKTVSRADKHISRIKQYHKIFRFQKIANEKASIGFIETSFNGINNPIFIRTTGNDIN